MNKEDIKSIDHYVKDLEITVENMECFVENSRDQLVKLKRAWKVAKHGSRTKKQK